MCSCLSHPACNTHASYIAICDLSGCTIFFPHYCINGTIFGKKATERKMCFDFLCIFCLKLFSFLEELSEVIP